jgi:protein-S-isoprenylcysteine O-methyltransferase Ste14
MNFLRKLMIGLGTPILAILVLITVLLTSVNMAFHTSANVKKWLAASDIYTHAVNAILDQTTKDTASSASDGLSFSQPEVQAVFKQVATPVFLQKNVETIIDSSYSWLQGKTAKPNYTIDITPIKTAFANALEASARARLATLPACSYRNVPTTTDPFSITCNPPASVVNADIAQVRNEILNGQGFLPMSTITADTTSLGNSSKNSSALNSALQEPAKPLYQQATSAPSVYKSAYYGPAVLAVLSLLIAIGIVFSARTRRSGLRIVASSLLSVGILLSLSAGASLFVLNHFTSTTAAQNAATSVEGPAIYTVRLAVNYIVHTEIYAGIALVVTGTVALIVLRITRPKAPKQMLAAKPPVDPILKAS